MKTLHLVGMKYRLGADPEKHGAVDCLNLCRFVLAEYGIKSTKTTRDWYRRFRREKDQVVFREELERWGKKTKDIKAGTIALCNGLKGGFALSVYWNGGWLIGGESAIVWRPLELLSVVEFYYPLKKNFVKQ